MSLDERRKAVRVAQPIEIEFASEGTRLAGRIEDLSEKGLFIDVAHPLPLGTAVSFRFALPDDRQDRLVVGRGRVVWSQHVTGMGVEFTELEPEDLDRIRFFVGAVFFGQTDELE